MIYCTVIKKFQHLSVHLPDEPKSACYTLVLHVSVEKLLFFYSHPWINFSVGFRSWTVWAMWGSKQTCTSLTLGVTSHIVQLQWHLPLNRSSVSWSQFPITNQQITLNRKLFSSNVFCLSIVCCLTHIETFLGSICVYVYSYQWDVFQLLCRYRGFLTIIIWWLCASLILLPSEVSYLRHRIACSQCIRLSPFFFYSFVLCGEFVLTSVVYETKLMAPANNLVLAWPKPVIAVATSLVRVYI